MGGCEVCGARLVPYLPQFVEPTFEQLARFAAVALKPDWIGDVSVEMLARLLEADAPDGAAYRNVREQHRLLQQAAYDEAWR